MTFTIADGSQVEIVVGSKIQTVVGAVRIFDGSWLIVTDVDNTFPYVWDGAQNAAIDPRIIQGAV